MKAASTLKCPLAGSAVAPGDTVFRLTEDVTVRELCSPTPRPGCPDCLLTLPVVHHTRLTPPYFPRRLLLQTIRLGALLNQSDDLIVTARAGTVQSDPGNKLWVRAPGTAFGTAFVAGAVSCSRRLVSDFLQAERPRLLSGGARFQPFLPRAPRLRTGEGAAEALHPGGG